MPSKIEKTAFIKPTNASARRCGWSPGQTQAVAQAFTNMPDKRLILIGDGPEMTKIRSKAGPNVTFTGFLPPEQVRAYLAKARAFIFPSEEDFGIVPVEAQACGTPVIAYGRGGALETVIPWPGTPQQGLYPTGVFFHEQTAESLSEAVWQFERIATELDAEKICQHAQIFSVHAFKASFARAVNEALKAG